MSRRRVTRWTCWSSGRVKGASDIRGYEHDWPARDADDHVALFSTAGGGYAPDEFLRDTEALHRQRIRAAPIKPRLRSAGSRMTDVENRR